MSSSSSRKQKSHSSFWRRRSRRVPEGETLKSLFRSMFFDVLPASIFFVGILSWLFFISTMHYVSSCSHLVLMCVPPGFVITLFVLRALRKETGEKVRIRYKKMTFIGVFIGCTLGTSAVAAYIDYAYAGGVIRELHSPIVAMNDHPYNESRQEIYCQVDQDTVKFSVSYDLWDSVYVGDTILLRIREGSLGCEFVDELIPLL